MVCESSQRGGEFSIPMRGNEPTFGFDEAGVGFEFSIPMRGNETQGVAQAGRDGYMFSIPMRGNEIHSAIGSPFSAPPVFDPHEG